MPRGRVETAGSRFSLVSRRRQTRQRRRRLALGCQRLDDRRLLMADFTLNLLHASDLEAGVTAIEDAPRFSAVVNALRDEAPDNTLLLSSGDNYIPGPFFNAGDTPELEPIIGTPGVGRADIAIMNAIGFDASAIGNHEFDAGPETFADIIGPDGSWPGAAFPYLSANLDFSGEPDLQALVDAGGIAKSTVFTVGGESIGVVGATTPLLSEISSNGDVGVSPDDPNDLAALAAIIQAEIDAFPADLNKVIVVSHLQQLQQEEELAGLLSGVDVLIAGGSDTLLADDDDVLRTGDQAERAYPILTSDADSNPVAIVSTDGQYTYVGRLNVGFDDAGLILPDSIDPANNGAYATDAAGVARVGGVADPTVEAITGAVFNSLEGLLSDLSGRTSVYLNGERASVRTEETNLGNLTADANLAVAREIDPTVQVSLKNGGGIRDSIGIVDDETGELLPPPGDQFRETGQVNQLEIQNALRFDNELALVTVTADELRRIMEHGVAASGPGVTQGRFPQIGGMRFSFDLSAAPGQRVQSLALVDDLGRVTDVVVRDGETVGDPDRPIRMVTLGFLADGGDGYFEPDADDNPTVGTDRVFTGVGEQAALDEYLGSIYDISPYAQADTPPELDQRIQNLGYRPDRVLEDGPVLRLAQIASYSTGVFDEGAAEIVAYDPASQRAYFSNADANTIGILDLSDPAAPTLVGEISLASFGGGVNSVAVSGGLVAVAVEAEDSTVPGTVAFFDLDGAPRGSVGVGVLPDSLAFTPDGSKIVVANEGEPDENDNDEFVDPPGSVSVIDLAGGPEAATVTTTGFSAFDNEVDALRAAGVRLFPGKLPSTDFEPEYVSISPDGSTAYVTLQEANAVAVVEIETAEILEIQALGLKDHSLPGNGIDPSDRDSGIDIRTVPVFGMYMPDAIATFEVDGETYHITTNEGDDRGDADDAEDSPLGDAIRLKDLADVETFGLNGLSLDSSLTDAFPDIGEDEQLGRLTISAIDGDIDGDGDIDQIHAYGSRSFTVWDAEGNLVFDSGDDFEQFTALAFPGNFNANNDENDFEGRSDNKGPEPEAVTTGVIDGRTYAFVGLERIGGIMVYDVTVPSDASFVQYINHRNFSVPVELDGMTNPAVGDLGVEDVVFIPAEDSPNGKPLLLSSNEVSGTVSVFEIGGLADPHPVVEMGRGRDHFTAARDGEDLVVTNRRGETVLRQPLADTRSLTVEGSRGSDSLTVDFASGGAFTLPDGVRFEGDRGSDRLLVTGGPERDLIDVYGDFVGANGLVIRYDAVRYVGVDAGDGDNLLGVTDPALEIEGVVGPSTVSPSARFVTLEAGDGDDTFVFDSVRASVSLHDDGGTDTVDFSGSDEGVRFDLARRGTQAVTRDLRVRVRGSLETAIGSDYADLLRGGWGDATLLGRGGNDLLVGGWSGANVLVGGSGNDRLWGGFHRDVLIGGEGHDFLFGGFGSDLLIGDSTVYDEDVLALEAIAEAWNGPGSVADRVELLQSGVGEGGEVRLLTADDVDDPADATVLDDGQVDRFFGFFGQDHRIGS